MMLVVDSRDEWVGMLGKVFLVSFFNVGLVMWDLACLWFANTLMYEKSKRSRIVLLWRSSSVNGLPISFKTLNHCPESCYGHSMDCNMLGFVLLLSSCKAR
jgi:hypothetical protein